MTSLMTSAIRAAIGATAALLWLAPTLSADRLSSYSAPPLANPGASGGAGYPGGPGSAAGGGGGPPPGGFGGPLSDAGFQDSGPPTPSIPETGFDCSEYEYPGYYADVEAECQIFHICQEDGRHDAFLCPNNTLFQQKYLICDWDYNVDCAASDQYFDVNAQIGIIPEGSTGNGGGGVGGGNGGAPASGFGSRNPPGGSFSNNGGGAPPPAPSLGYGAPGK